MKIALTLIACCLAGIGAVIGVVFVDQSSTATPSSPVDLGNPSASQEESANSQTAADVTTNQIATDELAVPQLAEEASVQPTADGQNDTEIESSASETEPPRSSFRITSVDVTDIGPDAATVYVRASDMLRSMSVRYGRSDRYGYVVEVKPIVGLRDFAAVTLRDLESDTDYHFEVCVDARISDGGPVCSDDLVFTTSAVEKPPYSDCAVVAGLLDSDTTWNGGTCYRLSGDVLVPEDVTLIIEGDATVVTQGFKLQVAGRLLAQGTEGSPVTFQGNASTMNEVRHIHFVGNHADESVLLWAEFNDCRVRIEGRRPVLVEHSVFLGHSGLGADSGPTMTVRKSQLNSAGFMYCRGLLFEENYTKSTGTGVYIWVGPGDTVLLNNRIDAKFGIQICAARDSNILIEGNDFSGCDSGVLLGSTSTLKYEASVAIVGNTFAGVNTAIRANEWLTSDILATGNWFGTTDSTVIAEMIHDYYDDLSLPKVLWEPCLSSAPH